MSPMVRSPSLTDFAPRPVPPPRPFSPAPPPGGEGVGGGAPKTAVVGGAGGGGGADLPAVEVGLLLHAALDPAVDAADVAAQVLQPHVLGVADFGLELLSELAGRADVELLDERGGVVVLAGGLDHVDPDVIDLLLALAVGL